MDGLPSLGDVPRRGSMRRKKSAALGWNVITTGLYKVVSFRFDI